MNETNKTIIIVAVVCIAAIGVGWMISSTLPSELTEPHGPMTGGDEMIHPYSTAMPEISMDEMIYVPRYPECVGEKMVLIDDPNKIEYENGTTVYHWLYTCQIAEMNRHR